MLILGFEASSALSRQITFFSMFQLIVQLVHPLGLKKNIEASNFELISFAFYVSHLVICRQKQQALIIINDPNYFLNLVPIFRVMIPSYLWAKKVFQTGSFQTLIFYPFVYLSGLNQEPKKKPSQIFFHFYSSHNKIPNISPIKKQLQIEKESEVLGSHHSKI